MASYHISPMGDPVLAGAVSNLAQIFAPKPATRAAGELAGAKVRRETALADAREYQNEQVRGLAQVFADNPQLAAVLGAGQGNAQQMAQAVGAFQEQRFRQQAADAAARGDYNAANAPLFGVANGPQQIPAIDGGYQIANRFRDDSSITPTGKTLAEIVSEEARARASDAQAMASRASAGASGARADLTRDQMANPDKYRTARGGSEPKPTKVSPNDVKSLDQLIGQLAPAGADFPADVRNDVLTRAAAIYQQTGNAQQSVADAFAELTDTTPAVEGSVLNILPFTSGPVRSQPAKIVRKGAAAPAAPASGAQAAQLPAAPAMPPPQALQALQEGKVTTFRNGQKWTLQNGQPKRVQ